MTDSLGIIYMAQGQIDTVSASLNALVTSIEIAEMNRPVSVVIIDNTAGDPQVGQLLANVEGAEIIRHSSRMPIGTAYNQAISRLETDLLFFTTDWTSCGPETLDVLATQMDNGAPMALPVIERPAAAMVRREIFLNMPELHPKESSSWVGYIYHLQLGVAGRVGAPVVVTDAKLENTSGVPYYRRMDPTEVKRDFRTVHPDAVQVGVCTSIGAGGVFQTYMPSDRIIIGHYCATADNITMVHPGPKWNEELVAPGGRTKTFFHGVNHSTQLPSVASFPKTFPGSIQEAVGGAYTGKPLRVGSDVWLAHSVVLMGRITIGNGAVIGTGSVVHTDVEPYAIMRGNPAEFVRWRFPEPIREALLRIKWWDWPLDKVFNNAKYLQGDIESFVERFDN